MIGILGSTWLSVFIIGPGAPDGASGPWAYAETANSMEQKNNAVISLFILILLWLDSPRPDAGQFIQSGPSAAIPDFRKVQSRKRTRLFLPVFGPFLAVFERFLDFLGHFCAFFWIIRTFGVPRRARSARPT
ncbi:MAG: hypothetical protein AB7T27_01465 [Kiritimatiellia bacterium]